MVTERFWSRVAQLRAPAVGTNRPGLLLFLAPHIGDLNACVQTSPGGEHELRRRPCGPPQGYLSLRLARHLDLHAAE
jgi:hypothetical protein